MVNRTSASPDRSRETADGVRTRALLGAGIFGFGFSGLIDVLVLHHVLQWHHLVSAIYPMDTLDGLRTNLLADGLFSIGMVIVAGIGAGVVWRAERRTTVPLAIRPLVGTAVVGSARSTSSTSWSITRCSGSTTRSRRAVATTPTGRS